MSNNISFKIDGVSHAVDITGAKTVVQFERHFNIGASVLSMQPRLEYIAYMAWRAAQNSGVEVPDEFDDFLDVVSDLTVVEDEEANANPTDGGQSAGS